MLTDREQYYKQCAVDYKNRARLKRCRAAVHIEDKNDQAFWAYVFHQYMPEASFDFVSYTRVAENKATGSSICLKYRNLGCLSKEFVIAIDSDEHYLMKEKAMDPTHYVLQTYTYSIENHYSVPAAINRAFLAKNKFENTTFDFDRFVVEFSRIIYPYFIYYLYSRKCRDEKIRREEFINSWDMDFSRIKIEDNASEYLAKVKLLTEKQLAQAKKLYPDLDHSTVEEYFRELGLTPDNAYLYIRGHDLFDKLITSITKAVYDQQVKEYVKSFSEEEKQNYFNRTLNSYHEYSAQSLQYDYPEIDRIGEDIQIIFQTI